MYNYVREREREREREKGQRFVLLMVENYKRYGDLYRIGGMVLAFLLSRLSFF
jgi:hypothetical protein